MTNHRLSNCFFVYASVCVFCVCVSCVCFVCTVQLFHALALCFVSRVQLIRTRACRVQSFHTLASLVCVRVCVQTSFSGNAALCGDLESDNSSTA